MILLFNLLYKMENYLRIKDRVHPDRLMQFAAGMIKFCRLKNKSLWVLSYKLKDMKGNTWFYGWKSTPNCILQSCMWCNSVIPHEEVIIIDCTDALNILTFVNTYKVVQNPNRGSI